MSTSIQDRKRAIVAALDDGRRWTHRLLGVLDDETLQRQYDPIMSPLVWDFGHIGNYEELWLLRTLGEVAFHDPQLDRVYDAFDNPRWTRSDLPIMVRSEATEYLQDVRAAVIRRLDATELDPEQPLLADGFVYSLVLQHEAQHQETMIQALDLGAATTPYPLAAPRASTAGPGPVASVDDTDRVHVPGGTFLMGTDVRRTYDNERPAHRVDVPSFDLDRFPVTTRRYAAFITAGGYDRTELWSDRGAAWLTEHGHRTPQGWEPTTDGGWAVRRLGHLSPLDPREPVVHVSYWEAQAFASWAGGRLPTEAEWEKAAAWDPQTGRSWPLPWGDSRPTPARANLDRSVWGPAPVGSYPTGASAVGVEQLLGDVWEWTSSDFSPYPGYATFPYPEYSEVFFGGDYKVLRGAAWAARASVARTTFRNWDHPYRRQIFAGFRLAWDG